MPVIHDIQPQQREGVITTPTFQIPAGVSGEIQVLADMATAEYEDPANQIFATLYAEDLTVPGGWRLRATNRPSGWRGGRFVDDLGNVNPPPTLFALSITDSERGRNFRAEFDIPTRMRVGLILQR